MINNLIKTKDKKTIFMAIPIFCVLVIIGWLLECGILKILTILFNGTFNWTMATIVFIVHLLFNSLKEYIKYKSKNHRV